MFGAEFPRPVHLGGSKLCFWSVAAVEDWEANAANHPTPALNVEPARNG
jgi:predicted DNA-binding transcriptional regulator AlpA